MQEHLEDYIMPDYEDTFYGQSPYEYHLPFQPQVERQYPGAMTPPYREATMPARPKTSASRSKGISKAEALSLARRLKRGLIVASFVGFGTLSGLAISHTVGVTASQTPVATPSQSQPSSGANDDNGNQGGFFGQQQQGGYGFGSNSSNSASAPVTHSGVS
jgi:hypothetical protein